jgi:hypothetical protein
VWNVWRAVLLIQQRDLLLQLEVSLDPLIRTAAALLWALLFVTLAVALWQRRRAVRWLVPAGLAFYTLYHLALVAWFMPATAARQEWLAGLLLSTLALIWLIWVLYRPALRAYWQTSTGS